MRRRINFWPYLFISPYLILFLAFQLVPLIQTIEISFMDWNGLSEAVPVGLKNFQQLFRDYMFLDALRNTTIYWLLSLLLVPTLAIAIGVALTSHRLRCARFFKTSSFLPYVCASVAMGLIFRMLFDENAGLINELLVRLGWEGLPWLTSSRFARIPVTALFVWRLVPWYTMIVISGLLDIPNELYESARVDGARGDQQFFYITLPMLSNILLFCSITLTVDAWKIFNESFTLSGPGSSNMSVFELLYESAFKVFKMGYGSAIGVVLIGILLFISLVQLLFWRRHHEM